MSCASCERIARICDRAEQIMIEQYSIKQGGHVNTLSLRAALVGKLDPWEEDQLNEWGPLIDKIDAHVQKHKETGCTCCAIIAEMLDADNAPTD